MTVLTQLQEMMTRDRLSLLYYDDPLTVAYLTGFDSEPHERVAAALIFPDKVWLIVPELEKQSALTARGCDFVLSYKDEESPWSILRETLQSEISLITNIGIDEDSLVVSRYIALKAIFPDALFSNSTALVQNLRVIKTDSELETMKEAGHLADKALKIGMDSLKTGITEQEVVARIEYEMKKLGVEKMSFPTMVLFGEHAASPHGNPGNRRLQPNEWVLFDLGVVYNGYTSDMTRTVVYGQADEKTKAIYTVVKEAQEKAQAFVKPGVLAGDIDRIARQHIEEAGYGDYFTHRLGHGLGKSVHEFPNIAPNVDVEIVEHMCFSIEPGIYIENYHGVRVEDCVYLDETGIRSFTHTTKELIELPINE